MVARTFVGLAILLALAGWLGKSWYDSRQPGTYSAMGFSALDYGGGTTVNHRAHPHVGVDQLEGPRRSKSDVRVTLVARKAGIALASGRTIDAWTFNGRVPGPEIRVRHGDLVEATLVNEDIEDGVTIHWRGVDVPNAEDGWPGSRRTPSCPAGATPIASASTSSGRSGTTRTRSRRSRCGAASMAPS